MTIDEKVHDIEERVHKILYSTSSREEIAERIVELEDENAGIKRRLERAEQLLGKREYDIGKLRELVSQLQTDLESEFDNAEQMEAKEEMYKAENERLREALESVLKCAGEIKRDSGCDTCTMYNWPEGSFADGSWCRLRPELRNLGFEV